MKNNLIVYVLIVFLHCSCSGIDSQKTVKNKLHISEDGIEFQLFQRNKKELPSDSGNVLLMIDDITDGQTNMTLKSGGTIILNRSIRDNDVVEFSFNSVKYSVECLDLVNKLFGEDYGNFIVRKKSGNTVSEKDESDKIESLLKKIEESNVIFIRNGSEYDSKAASDHLRSKWEQTDGQVKTLDDFIEHIASKSSMSGRPYLVKLQDGKIISAANWCKNEVRNWR